MKKQNEQQIFTPKPLQPLRILQRKEVSPECFIYQVIWKGLALNEFTWQTEQVMEIRHEEVLNCYLKRKGLSKGKKQIKAQEQFQQSYDLTGVQIQQEQQIDCFNQYQFLDQHQMQNKQVFTEIKIKQTAKQQKGRLRNRRKNNCRMDRNNMQNLKEKEFCISLNSIKPKLLKIISARKNEQEKIQFLVSDDHGKKIIGNQEMRKFYSGVLLDYYETKIRW